ncbi:proteasome assembly chaperone family protein [Candidatus Woesearchaeota archaeon]|nr:proteasome assembly chaperone family protein [Candidatus Woesearchaeota archaeon]
MNITLNEQPQRPLIIVGYPGFGLIGTITTEFLIEHLKMRQIGKVRLDHMAPMVAIHQKRLVDPIGVFYDNKQNIVVLHVVTQAKGIEGEIAKGFLDIADRLDAYRILSLEGVGSMLPPEAQPKDTNVYYYTSNDGLKEEIAKKTGYQQLDEGIVIGVTSVLLMDTRRDLVCFFAEAHSQLPDSKAAAKIIEGLDRYLGLEVDYQPLLASAAKFEAKLKGLMEQAQVTQEQADKKTMSYVG